MVADRVGQIAPFHTCRIACLGVSREEGRVALPTKDLVNRQWSPSSRARWPASARYGCATSVSYAAMLPHAVNARATNVGSPTWRAIVSAFSA